MWQLRSLLPLELKNVNKIRVQQPKPKKQVAAAAAAKLPEPAIEFRGKISRMGKRRIICVPSYLFEHVETLGTREIKVMIFWWAVQGQHSPGPGPRSNTTLVKPHFEDALLDTHLLPVCQWIWAVITRLAQTTTAPTSWYYTTSRLDIWVTVILWIMGAVGIGLVTIVMISPTLQHKLPPSSRPANPMLP